MMLRVSSTGRWAHSARVVRAFSLVEVVLATGIFAAAIIAVIGLLGPITKRVDDVIDSETAARLSASIQSELDRLALNLGFEAAAVLFRPNASIVLFADMTGTHVRVASAAGNNLISGDPPGIAERDRYFRITLTEQTIGGVLNPTLADMGAFPLRAVVEWPYWIPAGPPTPSATLANADPHAEVSANSRTTMSYFFALRR